MTPTENKITTSWGSYPSIFNLGHRAVKDLLTVEVNVEEKVDGCVSLDTPILKSDLRYVPAGLLKVGDSLIGFNDTLNDPRLTESIVTQAKVIKKACVDIETSEGNITVSEDHPFLVRQITNNNGKIWVKAADLLPEMCIVNIGYWQHESSWESGYLAGIFDGEGALVGPNGKHGTRTLSFYQKVGKELDRVSELINSRGFSFSVDIRQRETHHKQVGALILRKDWTTILKFLGMFRPERLIDKAINIWKDAALNSLNHVIVKNVTKSRNKLVMGLSTTTKTYIAKGLLSHNSQFSFCRTYDDELLVRSKGATMYVDAPEKMFSKIVEYIKSIKDYLRPGYTYRGEYLQKAKHNALAYERTPVHNFILFDINTGDQEFLPYKEKKFEAQRLEFETVPLLYSGKIDNIETFRNFLDTTSILGGQKIEGVVIKPKNYDLYGPDKKVLFGKFVSEAFKEIHKKEWGESNPKQNDILEILGATYRNQARWNKAIMHLKEAGKLQDSPTDIGFLIKEIPADIKKECEEEIKEALFKWAWSHIARKSVSGMAEWYKEELLKKQFEDLV